MSSESDKIMCYFKYYKRKQPPPNLSDVIDFTSAGLDNEIKYVFLSTPDIEKPVGVKDIGRWKAYTHKSYGGFVFIENPFEDGYQRYWAYRCLHDYNVKPSKTNIDIHEDLSASQNIWELSQNDKSSKSLLQRLRWTTLGYHHNWDTKVYSKGNYTPFPHDLSYLSKYISCALGWNSFEAQAAIINYYHMDSTLSGHTDHSEFDQTAPLISVSFGQTAIFLVGGENRTDEPIAVYLRSGDIAVMMGPRRLAYHAVPRILSSDSDYVHNCFGQTPNETIVVKEVPRLNTEGANSTYSNVSCCEKCSCGNSTGASAPTHTYFTENTREAPLDLRDTNQIIIDKMKYLSDDKIWEPFGAYLDSNRINMNIRQVLKPGEDFPSA